MLSASDNVFAKAQAIVKVKSPNSGQDARQTAGLLFLNEVFSAIAPLKRSFAPFWRIAQAKLPFIVYAICSYR